MPSQVLFLGREKDSHERTLDRAGHRKRGWEDWTAQGLESILSMKNVSARGESSDANIEEHSIVLHLLAGLRSPPGGNLHVSTFPSSLLSASPRGAKL